MNNKRGQGLSTNTIILLILGIVILVVLILGFTMGWSKLLPFIKSNNVGNIVNACQLACSNGETGKYDFCSLPRNLNDGEKEIKGVTCDALSIDDETTDYEIYDIKKCPGITCTKVAEVPAG